MRREFASIEHTIEHLAARIRVRVRVYAPADVIIRTEDGIPHLTLSFPAPDGENLKTLRQAIDRRFIPFTIQDGRVVIIDRFDRLVTTTRLFYWMRDRKLAWIEQKEFPREVGAFPLYINGRGWRLAYNIGSVLLTEAAGLWRRWRGAEKSGA